MSQRYQAAILTASYNGLQVPNAPTIGTATAGSGSASVTFTAPSNVGGGAITSYTVISSPGGITGTGASSPVTVSGLTNGTAYTFTVVATNAYGTGPASGASNSVTPAVNYIENVFSTYLYTGNGATQTITNGIDLSGKGGLVWFKGRTGTISHSLYDTVRGREWTLSTNTTTQQEGPSSLTEDLTSFNSNGFSLGTPYWSTANNNGVSSVSWTFREQAKFFDIVTWTGDSNNSRMLSHSLGSVPGCIITKCTSTTSNWFTWHIASGIATSVTGFQLNGISGPATTGYDASADFTSTQFRPAAILDSSSNEPNVSGRTYVAYIFASNAGGFGLTGADNVITCGSYTGNGSTSGPIITLGYEPQWIMIKRNGNTNWVMIDSMRGFVNSTSATPSDPYLEANTTRAETTWGADYGQNAAIPLATGFQLVTSNASLNLNSTAFYYIAIRRGPMAVPTVGTSVYNGIARTGNGTATTVSNSGFTPDMVMSAPRTAGPSYGLAFPFDRLRGALKLLETRSTQAEQTGTGTLTGFDTMNGYIVGTDAASYGAINTNSVTYINWNFQRAPGFFDEVCYTSTGTSQTINHNLGVVPELAICKSRSNADNWEVAVVNPSNPSQFFVGQSSGAQFAINLTNGWGTSPFITADYLTATTFGSGTWWDKGVSARTYVAYLFATCAGVSKVGSYTGTGALQTINCAFTTGARFVLIKRADDVGDWYVWDSARGITSGNDPYLLLNSLAAEVTGTNYVDSTAAGFQVTAAAPAGLNAVGGNYIFLAIA